MASNKEVDKAIEAIINLASALGITEGELADIIEEGIVFDNSGKFTDKTVEIVRDVVTSPEIFRGI
jgi:hypothetical protein